MIPASPPAIEKDYSASCAACNAPGPLYTIQYCDCPLCLRCAKGVTERCPYCHAGPVTPTDDEAEAAAYPDEPVDMEGWEVVWKVAVILLLLLVLAALWRR